MPLLRACEWVAVAWIADEALVGQAFQERQQGRAVVLREREPDDEDALERIQFADARVRPLGDGAATLAVVIQHGVERRDAAVVHVRRRQRDVAQALRSEQALVERIERELVDPLVAGRVTAVAADVVQAVVEERVGDRSRRAVRIAVGDREVDAAVAVEALELLGVEQAQALELLRETPLRLGSAPIMLGVLGGALVWCFWTTIVTMADRWANEAQYSHGFLVPLFALVILWVRRDRFVAESQPNLWGLALLVGAVLLSFLGALVNAWLDAASLAPMVQAGKIRRRERALGRDAHALQYRDELPRVLRRVPGAALEDAMRVSAMSFILIVAASTFAQMLSFSGSSAGFVQWASGLSLGPTAMLAIMFAIVLVLGCFIDSLSIMLLTMPLYLPLAQSFGFDLVWFCTIMLIGIEIGFTTPPFGMLLFVMMGVVPGTTLGEVSRAALPYIACQIAVIVLLVAAPGLVLVLPRLLQ